MKYLLILTAVLASQSCMTTTDAKGNTVRKVDPEARRFYGGLAARALINATK